MGASKPKRAKSSVRSPIHTLTPMHAPHSALRIHRRALLLSRVPAYQIRRTGRALIHPHAESIICPAASIITAAAGFFMAETKSAVPSAALTLDFSIRACMSIRHAPFFCAKI